MTTEKTQFYSNIVHVDKLIACIFRSYCLKTGRKNSFYFQPLFSSYVEIEYTLTSYLKCEVIWFIQPIFLTSEGCHFSFGYSYTLPLLYLYIQMLHETHVDARFMVLDLSIKHDKSATHAWWVLTFLGLDDKADSWGYLQISWHMHANFWFLRR